MIVEMERALLDARLAAHEAASSEGASWVEVRAQSISRARTR